MEKERERERWGVWGKQRVKCKHYRNCLRCLPKKAKEKRGTTTTTKQEKAIDCEAPLGSATSGITVRKLKLYYYNDAADYYYCIKNTVEGATEAAAEVDQRQQQWRE